MSLDLFLASLLITLGAMIAYVIDEHFGFTPRFTTWLGRMLDES